MPTRTSLYQGTVRLTVELHGQWRTQGVTRHSRAGEFSEQEATEQTEEDEFFPSVASVISC